jgi:hypothetical protein
VTAFSSPSSRAESASPAATVSASRPSSVRSSSSRRRSPAGRRCEAGSPGTSTTPSLRKSSSALSCSLVMLYCAEDHYESVPPRLPLPRPRGHAAGCSGKRKLERAADLPVLPAGRDPVARPLLRKLRRPRPRPRHARLELRLADLRRPHRRGLDHPLVPGEADRRADLRRLRRDRDRSLGPAPGRAHREDDDGRRQPRDRLQLRQAAANGLRPPPQGRTGPGRPARGGGAADRLDGVERAQQLAPPAPDREARPAGLRTVRGALPPGGRATGGRSRRC